MSAVISDAFRLTVRDSIGGGASRALRRQGMVPGILYGSGKENVALSVDPRDIMKGLNTSGFYSKIYEIKVKNAKERVLVRDVQLHPVTDQPMHIDFMRVSKGAKIHLYIPIHFKNEDKCPGLKRGGVLNVVLHSLEVTCSVDNIPDHIEVDLEGLEIGHSIHTDQIQLGDGVVPTHPERDITIVTLLAPSTMKSAEEETEAAAPEPAAETLATEASSPEASS